jgi:hypothetical protein
MVIKTLDKAAVKRWRGDPVAFIREVLINPENGQPFELYAEEAEFMRRAFTLSPAGRLSFSEIVFGGPKKSGKTAVAAWCAIYVAVAVGGSLADIYCLSNDYEQSVGRVFESARRIVEASPLLRSSAKITAGRIQFRSTGSFIQAVVSDYASFAGANPSLCIFDELWGYVSERSRRLWDEAVPSPTRKVSARLTVSYAGFEGESDLLEGLYTRGIDGEEVAPDLYESAGMLCYWTHECRAPWQSERWIGEMRQALRPNQFARMIRNQWVRGEGDFLQDEWIAACTNPALRPSLGDTALPIFVGIDASTKHDWCAVVATAYDDASQKVRLVRHYVWKPTPNQPLDFASTIERAVIELQGRFWIQSVSFDPWQLSALSQRLTDAGVPMAEYPQTLGNLTAMGENLLALFKDRNIEIYDDGDLRWSLTNAVGVESARGFKIGKPSTGKKIDIVIALAMSALAAVRHNRDGFGIFEYYRRRASGDLTLDDDGGMADVYQAALDELERGDNRCAACHQPLHGVTLDSGPLGRFHPECFGVEKPPEAPAPSSNYDESVPALAQQLLDEVRRGR